MTGPDTLDDVYIVDAANPNPVIDEDANPAIGGFDRAVVSIDAYPWPPARASRPSRRRRSSIRHHLVGNDLADTVIGGIGDDTLEGSGTAAR